MAVAIAYEQGILTQPDISPLQRWALTYHLYEQRRVTVEDENRYWRNFVEVTNMSSGRTQGGQPHAEDGVISEQGVDEIEQGFDDPEELEAILRQIGSTNQISAEDLAVNNGEWV